MQQSNFIPTRMRGQGWMVGNISVIKVGANLLVIAICALFFLPLLTVSNALAMGLFITFALIGTLLTWISRQQTPLGIYLYRRMVFLVSYNNFHNAKQASIFDLYERKQSIINVNAKKKIQRKDIKMLKPNVFTLRKVEDSKKVNSGNDIDNQKLAKRGILAIKKPNGQHSYLMVFHINGFNINHKSQAEQELIIDTMHTLFRGIPANHSLIKIRQPINFSDNIEESNKQFLNVDLALNLEQRKQQRYILETKIAGFVSSNKDANNIISENNWFLVVSHNNGQTLTTVQEDIVKSFAAKASITATPLSPGKISNVFISLYAPYISFNDQRVLESNPEKWSDILNFAMLQFLPGQIVAQPQIPGLPRQVKTYMKVSALKYYRQTPPPFGWLYSLANAFDSLVIHNTLIDKEKLQKLLEQSFENTELKRSKSINRAKQTEMDFLYQSYQNLSDAVGSGNEEVYDSAIYGINYDLSENRTGAIKSFSQSQIIAKKLGFTFDPLHYRQRLGFLDLFIKDEIYLKEFVIPLPLYCYAFGFPFVSSFVNDKGGFLLGYTPTREPIIFDITAINSVRTNNNMAVLGQSGSGKSTFLKLLIIHLYGSGHRIITVDPEYEMENRLMVKALGGDYIDLHKSRINPMVINHYQDIERLDGSVYSVYNIEEKVAWLSEFFKLIIGDSDTQGKPLNYTILTSFLINFYEKLGFKNKVVNRNEKVKWPSVGDFLEDTKSLIEQNTILGREKDIEFITMSEFVLLLSYAFDPVKKGIVAHIWNTRESDLDISSSNLVCFNVRDLSDKIKTPAYSLLLDLANQEMNNNKEFNDKRKRIDPKAKPRFLALIFDEGHLFINANSPVTTNYLNGTMARCRKYSTSLIIATQSIDTFFPSAQDNTADAARKILENAQTSVILKMAPNKVEKVSTLFSAVGGFSEAERAFLATGQKGDCLLVLSSKSRHQLRIDIGGDAAFNHYTKDFIKNDHSVSVQVK